MTLPGDAIRSSKIADASCGLRSETGSSGFGAYDNNVIIIPDLG